MIVEKDTPRIGDRRASEKIRERFPEHYKSVRPGAIRNQLSAARLTSARWFGVALDAAVERVKEAGAPRLPPAVTAAIAVEEVRAALERDVAEGTLKREDFRAAVVDLGRKIADIREIQAVMLEEDSWDVLQMLASQRPPRSGINK